MKTVSLFLVCVYGCLVGCAGFRTYSISAMSTYDVKKEVFVPVDVKKIKDGILVVSATDYVVYTDDKKLFLRRMSSPSEYSDAVFSDVRYMGGDFRLVEYHDDGYYDEGRTTFILFDKKKSEPIMSFSFDKASSIQKRKKEDVEKYLKDPEIVAQSKIAPQKGVKAKPERMYLFKRGF